MKEKKRVKIVVASIIALLITWNLVWFAYYSIGFNKYTEPLDDMYGVKMLIKDDYTYSVKKPSYLSFVGNIAMTASNHEGLIMWPNLFGEDVYGITILVNNERYDILLDENINLVGKTNNRDAEKVLKENKEKIENLYKQARLVWDI